LTDSQISSIEAVGEPQTYFDILATIPGTVMMRHIAVGDYVKQGQQLFQLINLSQVWVMFDAYESDLPWLQVNDPVQFTVQALPGKTFSGKISFIDPFLHGNTRVAKVRVVVNNPAQELKPEMFVNGIVVSGKATKSDELLIPKSAVLWTGKRSVVYVKVPEAENPTFSFRQITLGPETGNFYVVNEGLAEGEEIAVNGVFKIDAAAQLQGVSSMMNPEGGATSTGHNHAGMEMSMSKMKDKQADHAMFHVSGNCEMCKERIETAAISVNGVLSAVWEPDDEMMHLQFDPGKTTADAVQKTIAAVGHDTEKHKAPDAVYNDLPGCCLYR